MRNRQHLPWCRGAPTPPTGSKHPQRLPLGFDSLASKSQPDLTSLAGAHTGLPTLDTRAFHQPQKTLLSKSTCSTFHCGRHQCTRSILLNRDDEHSQGHCMIKVSRRGMPTRTRTRRDQAQSPLFFQILSQCPLMSSLPSAYAISPKQPSPAKSQPASPGLPTS